MKYAKIENRIVVQVQPNNQDGFVEVPNNVTCGMMQTENGFENPPKDLEQARSEKANEINTACGNEITSGFVSDALGTAHNYQSAEIDQLNLIGIVTAGDDDYFKAGVDTDGVIAWNYEMHTIEQLTQVLKDGKAYKQVLLQKANGLKVQIADATTIDALDLISW